MHTDWASNYVKLVLAVGRHDANFVDAYSGPPDWRAAAEAGDPRPLDALAAEARGLLEGVAAWEVPADETLRRDYLMGQLGAVVAHLARLQGLSLIHI